jgi:hypothetical protein
MAGAAELLPIPLTSPPEQKAACTGNQQCADVRILAALLDHPAQRWREMVGQRISCFQSVQGDHCDAIPDCTQQFVRPCINQD